MKFFHLSDLHIGLKLINRDLAEDQSYILHQITELAAREQPDAVVIAGDIYDKAIPSAEAVELFDRFLLELSEAVPGGEIMMISGNHDSAPRINVFRSLLRHQHVHMVGMMPQRPEEYIEKVTLHDAYGPVHFYLLPFVRPSMVKAIVGVQENGNNLSYDGTIRALLVREQIDETERNVLVSHQFYLPVGADAGAVERMDSEVRTVGNIDEVRADVLEPFDYAALGHIHKPMKVGSEYFRYCGTPLACSVSEAGQQKGVLMVELKEKGKREVTVLPLIPLREVRVLKGHLNEVLAQSCEDYVTVILTDDVEFDIFDLQDRIRAAFPNLLEIRREGIRSAEYGTEVQKEEAELDAYTLCCSFLGDLDEAEQELLRDAVNAAEEVR